MHRVAQTKFGAGLGNCLQAAIASILERKLDTVPDFATEDTGWFQRLYVWCMQEGLGLLLINPHDLPRCALLNCHALLIYSVAGHADNHAVVGRCMLVPEAGDGEEWCWQTEVVWDPNPQTKKLENLLDIVVFLPGLRPLDRPDA